MSRKRAGSEPALTRGVAPAMAEGPPGGKVAGAVLAGGRSSRMGRDKAFLEFRGRTFLEIAAASLLGVVGEVMIIAGDARAYAIPGCTVYPDIYERCGPLGGIHSALTHAQSEAVLIASCDLPLLSAPLLRSVLAGPVADVAVPRAGGQIQPLCALYRKSFLPIAEEYLARGELRMRRVLEDPRVCVRIVDSENDSGALTNINTPAEYRRLLAGS